MFTWERPSFMENSDGLLSMNGVGLVDLARDRGTPLFVFSEATIRENVRSVLNAFTALHRKSSVYYAAKANSNLAILKIIKSEGASIEVNSIGELFKATICGYQPSEIVLNGVGKTKEELIQAIKLGIRSINLDSAYELDRTAELSKELGITANVSLRIVPEVRTTAHAGIATGTVETKFGIAPNEFLSMCSKALSHGRHLNLVGLHMHVGSQTTDVSKFEQATRNLLAKAKEAEQKLSIRFEMINLGGGFPVDYSRRMDLDLPPYLKATIGEGDVAKAVVALVHESLGHEIELAVEPGRKIVGDAGVLLTTIQNRKERNGTRWLIVDAGFNTLLESFDYKWYFHTILANKLDREHDTAFRLGGPLCDSGDVFYDIEGEEMLHETLLRLPRLDPDQKKLLRRIIVRMPEFRLFPEDTEVNDLVAFLDVGAYVLEQMTQYNGRPRPEVDLVRQHEKVEVIRRQDTLTDLITNDVVWS